MLKFIGILSFVSNIEKHLFFCHRTESDLFLFFLTYIGCHILVMNTRNNPENVGGFFAYFSLLTARLKPYK